MTAAMTENKNSEMLNWLGNAGYREQHTSYKQCRSLGKRLKGAILFQFKTNLALQHYGLNVVMETRMLFMKHNILFF